MKDILVQSIKQFFALIFIFLVIRVVEYAIVCGRGTLDFSLSFFFSRSVNFDTFFLYGWSFFFLLVALVIRLFHKRVAAIVLKASALGLVVIHLLLTGYFLLSNNILYSSIFEFSVDELRRIIGHEFSVRSVLVLTAAAAIAWASYRIIYRKSVKLKFKKPVQNILITVYVLLGCIVFINRANTSKSIRYFDSNFEYLIGNSKETLFIQSFDTKPLSFTPKDIAEQSALFQKNNPEFTFSNTEYPLIHNEPYTNVLGPYFIKDSTIKPNIVLIISESLSSSFSGTGCATPVSLTPFIDSLAWHGLSWNNFLANAERSHGVFTNVISSLPSGIGQRGFVNMTLDLPNKKWYPEHTSLLEPLAAHEYTSNYYNSGWGNYDHTERFLLEHGIDHFATGDSFSSDIYTPPKGGGYWGYNDKDLYHMALNLKHNLTRKSPFIDIYQTLSLHTPFNLVTEEYKSNAYIRDRIEQLGVQPDQISTIPMYILGSIFFSEDALKDFISAVKTKKEYENTIFIITGDHGIDYPISNKPLERYKVPLVIYSNLLTKNASFNGYCSHIDIAPSILALLEGNFGFQLPKEKHWLGHGLDTSHTFRNSKKIPLAVYSDHLAQYMSGNYIKYTDRIVKFDSALNISEVTDQQIVDRIKSEFDTYLFMNEYSCSRDRIWKK